MAALSMTFPCTLTQKAFQAQAPVAQSKAVLLHAVKCRQPLAVQGSRTQLPASRTIQSRQSVIASASTTKENGTPYETTHVNGNGPVTQENGTIYADFLDEDAMLAASTFPIKPEDLVAKAKAWLSASLVEGIYDADSLADSFEFVAPVVGPLTKDAFLTAIATFDLKEGIPDLTGNMHHFRVDPYIHNRVWFTSISKGTHTGTLAGAIKATGKAFQSTPQTCSVTFNEEGQVLEYTIGYPMDRRLGTTGGLGGIFGIFYAVGAALPFPEAHPWKMSKRYRFFNFFGELQSKMKKKD